jgi:5-methylcytosine-specific restriction enzyme subunit McrC
MTTEAPDDDRIIELTEYDQSKPLDLSEGVLRAIDDQINRDANRIDYEYSADGDVRLSTSSHVGLVSLPDDTQVRIRPKAAGENFLRLLLYAQGSEPEILDSPVDARSGNLFVDTIGALFAERVTSLFNRGLGKAYRTEESREQYLRGRLNVQKQLARGDVTATQFDVRYEELTHDTPENQAILYATRLLLRLVTDRSLQQSLRQHEQLLRREVTLRPVRPHEFDQMHLNRLTSHYEDVLRLAELVVRSTFVDNFRSGTRGTYGLLVNMNRVFEAAVEQAAKDALSNSNWTVEPQSRLRRLVTGGTPRINMYPDFVLRDSDGTLRLVGDAKWKTGTVSQSDVYQMTSYQLADDAPGVLVYPSQNGVLETEYEIDKRLPLRAVELPTSHPSDNFDDFTSGLSAALKAEFSDLIFDL